jgi:hypothetical protein
VKFWRWTKQNTGLITGSAAMASLAACVLACGCTSQSPTGGADGSAAVSGIEDLETFGAVPDAFRPLDDEGEPLAQVDSSAAAASQAYGEGSPVYHANGIPIDYRPRNIQRQIASLPALYLRDIGQTPVDVQSRSGLPKLVYLADAETAQVFFRDDRENPRTDPATGEVCWRAMTCNNPNCLAEQKDAFAFAPSVQAARFDESTGALLWGSRSTGEGKSVLYGCRCPNCGRTESIRQYNLPNSARRKAELVGELARIRAARARNRQ